MFDLLILCVIIAKEFEPEDNKQMEWWLDVPFFILKCIKNIRQVRLSNPKHQISAKKKKIHFDNIFKFYQKCFANKRLYLYVTCSINNTWVERCLGIEAILLWSVFVAPTRLPVYHDNNGRRLISLYRITDPKLCLYGAQKCMSGFISINNIFFSVMQWVDRYVYNTNTRGIGRIRWKTIYCYCE